MIRLFFFHFDKNDVAATYFFALLIRCFDLVQSAKYSQVEQVVVDLCQCIKLQNGLALSLQPCTIHSECACVAAFLHGAGLFHKVLRRCTIAWFSIAF